MLVPTWQGKEPTIAGKNKSNKRHAPKVRTGCVTCKMRRIKCDEGKPECSNGNRTCVFQATQTKMFIPVPGPPKTSRRPHRSCPVIKCKVLGQRYGTLEEMLSLHIYLNRIGPFASLYFSHPTLWTIAFPCASWGNAAVKHALVAATLADVNVTSGIISETQISRASYHYRLAIKHLTAQDVKVETVLCAGILIWLYEMMKGNAKHSMMHLVGLRQIIRETMAEQGIASTETDFDHRSVFSSESHSSPLPTKTLSECTSFLLTVDLVVKECESYTHQLLGGANKSTTTAACALEPESPVRSEPEHLFLITKWEAEAQRHTLAAAVSVLESFMGHLADECTKGGMLSADKSRSSSGSEKRSIAEATVFLNRWFLVFRTHCAGDSDGESRVVLRLYQTVFALVKLRLYRALEASTLRTNQMCRCEQRLSSVSEDIWKLAGEAQVFPVIKRCVSALMRCVMGKVRSQT